MISEAWNGRDQIFQLLYGLWYKKRKEGGERRGKGKGSVSGVGQRERKVTPDEVLKKSLP